jgi:hypothetical protein
MTGWRERLDVPDRKIFGYLLNPDHPIGGPKSRYLAFAGYSVDNAEALRAALIEHGRSGTLSSMIETPYGRKYVVKGPLQNPVGGEFPLTTVWIRHADGRARFVSAVPGKR